MFFDSHGDLRLSVADRPDGTVAESGDLRISASHVRDACEVRQRAVLKETGYEQRCLIPRGVQLKFLGLNFDSLEGRKVKLRIGGNGGVRSVYNAR
jgi:hypothetical protein